MVRRLLPLLLTAALVVLAAPRVLVDNRGEAQLSGVEDAGRLALAEGIDDAGDEQLTFFLPANIESTVDPFPITTFCKVAGFLKQRRSSSKPSEIYARNYKIII